MKVCGKCKEEKELDCFAWRSKTKGTKVGWCKICMKAYDKERQQSGVYKERKYALVKARIEKSREFLWDYLKNNPCVDCGFSDPRILEFDHRDPQEKAKNVVEMFHHGVEAIKKEIAKCDVRCPNCHRLRTVKQFNTWRNGM